MANPYPDHPPCPPRYPQPLARREFSSAKIVTVVIASSLAVLALVAVIIEFVRPSGPSPFFDLAKMLQYCTAHFSTRSASHYVLSE
jgi:hypothetical protein